MGYTVGFGFYIFNSFNFTICAIMNNTVMGRIVGARVNLFDTFYSAVRAIVDSAFMGRKGAN